MLHNQSNGSNDRRPAGADERPAQFSFAFQPIVDLESGEVIGQEALVRGNFGEAADTVLQTIRAEIRELYDQACRKRAMEVAGRLGIDVPLHLNCAGVTPANLEQVLKDTVTLARHYGIDPGSLVFEFGRLEPLGSPRELNDVRERCASAGIQVLADNFGSSEVGLKRLVVFRPQWLKLDRNLVDRIHCSERRQALVHGVLATCRMLGIEVIASGVEHEDEVQWLRGAGVRYAQGFLYSRPAFESLPRVKPVRLSA